MQRIFGAINCWIFLGTALLGCSTAKKGGEGASQNSSVSTGSEKISTVREPSPVDSENPPSIRISGLESDGLYEEGQTLQIVVKNYPVSDDWQGFELLINDGTPERFFDSNVVYKLPKAKLRKGANLIKAYLLRSWGESLKNPEAFAFLPFYFEERRGLSWVSPGRPILTLVSPRGVYSGNKGEKILFDFIVHDPESEKPWNVHYTLNGTKLQLESGRSYDFSGLSPDDYDLRVEVVNSRGIPLGQEVTRARSKFTVKSSSVEASNNDQLPQ
jgi:hypothetical protein